MASTLYLEVEDRRESLPGTEQKTSPGETVRMPGSLLHQSLVLRPAPPQLLLDEAHLGAPHEAVLEAGPALVLLQLVVKADGKFLTVALPPPVHLSPHLLVAPEPAGPE